VLFSPGGGAADDIRRLSMAQKGISNLLILVMMLPMLDGVHGGIHGIHGIGDLDTATYEWRNPVAHVEVVRVK